MSKGVELTEKELKEVVGGVCIADGYVYFTAKGQNKRVKILSNEDEVKKLCDSSTNDDALVGLLYWAHYTKGWVGIAEDC